MTSVVRFFVDADIILGAPAPVIYIIKSLAR